MSRFDPATYPDRLAFDAYARQLRSQELARLYAPIRAWLASTSERTGRTHWRSASPAQVRTVR